MKSIRYIAGAMLIVFAAIAFLMMTPIAQAQEPTPTATPEPTEEPGATEEATSPPEAVIIVSTPNPDGSVVHVVSEGETLGGIALSYGSVYDGVTVESIQELNGLSEGDFIQVGQRLTIVAAQGSEPTTEPTTAATAEGGGEATPEETTAPTAEPQTTPEAPPANEFGTICVLAYNDQNASRTREAGEQLLAGVTITVNDGSQEIATYTTDGSGPYCFTQLTPGSYVVSWAADGYEPTTEQTWLADVGAGERIGPHEFGVQSTADAGSGIQGGLPTWATALIAAVGVVFVLGGIGIAGFFLFMRRNQTV